MSHGGANLCLEVVSYNFNMPHCGCTHCVTFVFWRPKNRFLIICCLFDFLKKYLTLLQVSDCGFESRHQILFGVSNASSLMGKKIKIFKQETLKYLKSM